MELFLENKRKLNVVGCGISRMIVFNKWNKRRGDDFFLLTILYDEYTRQTRTAIIL